MYKKPTKTTQIVINYTMSEEYFRLQFEIIKTMLNEMPDWKKARLLCEVEKIVTEQYTSHRYCHRHIDSNNKNYMIKQECEKNM